MNSKFNNNAVEVINKYSSGASIPHLTTQGELLKQIVAEREMRLELWLSSEGSYGYEDFFMTTGLELDKKTKRIKSVTFTEVE